MAYDPKYINATGGFTVAQRIALLKTLDSYSGVPATTTTAGVVKQAAARADSAAADVAALNVIFNDLLAKLRTAGILAP